MVTSNKGKIRSRMAIIGAQFQLQKRFLTIEFSSRIRMKEMTLNIKIQSFICRKYHRKGMNLTFTVSFYSMKRKAEKETFQEHRMGGDGSQCYKVYSEYVDHDDERCEITDKVIQF